MTNRKIGTAETIGELKKLIDSYPDETVFNFRNQAAQTLYELTDKGQTTIYFDYKIVKTKYKITKL